jgi:import inner membrane translocase subunit TIM22
MSSSFAYEDPYLRSQTTLNTTQKARQIFKEMGKGMWSSGRSFGKIGALFAGVECVIESVCLIFTFLLGGPFTNHMQYRAKNDIYNSVSAGFISGGILARSTGPKGVLTGGLAFAAFSAAIDLLFIRRETYR